MPSGRPERLAAIPAFLALFVLLAAGARAAPPLLSAKDLQADAAILRRAYETLHPGLYRYNTPAQMDQAFKDLNQEFSRDRTLAEAYLAFSVFAAKVKCGHTYANFYNQPDDIAATLFRAGRVPFYFRWLGDRGERMIVTRSFASDPRLRAGTEVLAINGTPAAAILARLLTVARADGNNAAKRLSYLEVQGTDRYEAFDIFLPLFFPFRGSKIALRIQGPDGGAPIDLDVEPVSLDHRLEQLKAAGKDVGDKEAAWDLRLLENHLAYLRMPTWALYDSEWDWKTFLTQSFETLVKNGTTDLVIDLRGNEGGIDVGDEILRHLTTKDVTRQPVFRRVRYQKVPDDLLPYLDTWDKSFRDWGAAALEPRAGFYRLRRDADDDPGSAIRPALPTFTGRTWVLIGAANSSATFEFSEMLRQNGLGTLVGQPTGGNQRGINGGAFFFLRLPNSRIELDLPLIGQFPETERPDAGLQPDLLVTPTVGDIATGRDAEMEAVKDRIRSLTNGG